MTINFVLLKVSKNDQFENLYISSYREARNITFGLHLKLIQRVLLSTLSQEVLILLPHNHVTFSLVTEGLILSNLGSKNNYLIKIHRALHYLLIMGH